MKIKIPNNKSLIRRQISALKVTKKQYLEDNHFLRYDTCALCKSAGVSNVNDTGTKAIKQGPYQRKGLCRNCPWSWFTGKICSYYKLPELYDYGYKRAKKRRIKQIDLWIDELEKYLEVING